MGLFHRLSSDVESALTEKSTNLCWDYLSFSKEVLLVSLDARVVLKDCMISIIISKFYSYNCLFYFFSSWTRVSSLISSDFRLWKSTNMDNTIGGGSWKHHLAHNVFIFVFFETCDNVFWILDFLVNPFISSLFDFFVWFFCCFFLFWFPRGSLCLAFLGLLASGGIFLVGEVLANHVFDFIGGLPWSFLNSSPLLIFPFSYSI